MSLNIFTIDINVAFLIYTITLKIPKNIILLRGSISDPFPLSMTRLFFLPVQFDRKDGLGLQFELSVPRSAITHLLWSIILI